MEQPVCFVRELKYEQVSHVTHCQSCFLKREEDNFFPDIKNCQLA